MQLSNDNEHSIHVVIMSSEMFSRGECSICEALETQREMRDHDDGEGEESDMLVRFKVATPGMQLISIKYK